MTKKASSQKLATTTLERTPIVAVMGHVDHGKTSLLDAIRGTQVQLSEVGGITQNTRAHQIEYKNQKITFIDTPGHEAFSNMRARGASVTDIVLLVVAADDGVQPQTKESIKFALAEKVPVIVAINKIDLPGQNLDKIKRQLSDNGLVLEEYGGDVIVNLVSAKTKKGLDDLLESILLLAEVQGLKRSEPEQGIAATGFVLESTLDKHLGPVSLVIIKSGNLSKDGFVVFEGGYSSIRGFLNEKQQPINDVLQGDPVWIIGIKKVLSSGEIIKFVSNEKQAKELSKKIEIGEVQLIEQDPASEEAQDDLDLLAELIGESKQKDDIQYLNVVLKSDTQGTLEAIISEIQKLNDDLTQVKIISSGTGDISEQDVQQAKNSHGIVLGFQVKINKQVSETARKERVLVREYAVIYDLLEEISEVLSSMGAPDEEEVEVARALVKQIFVLSNGQIVAGSEVTKGLVIKGYRVFVERDGQKMEKAKITSLKQNKNDVKEVKKGQDCGIIVTPIIDIQVGDFIVCYKVEKS